MVALISAYLHVHRFPIKFGCTKNKYTYSKLWTLWSYLNNDCHSQQYFSLTCDSTWSSCRYSSDVTYYLAPTPWTNRGFFYMHRQIPNTGLSFKRPFWEIRPFDHSMELKPKTQVEFLLSIDRNQCLNLLHHWSVKHILIIYYLNEQLKLCTFLFTQKITINKMP